MQTQIFKNIGDFSTQGVTKSSISFHLSYET